MAISRVQYKSGFVQGGSPITVTFDSATSAGSAIVIAYGSFFTGLTGSGSDNNGSTFATVLEHDGAQGTFGFIAAYNIAGRSGHQVTLTFAAGQYVVMTAIEVSGIATSSAFDQSSYVDGATGPDFGSGTVTTTQASEYLVGLAHLRNNSTFYSPGTGWSGITDSSDGTFHHMNTQDQVVAATSTYESTYVYGAGGAPDSAIVTFKAAVGGATGQPTTKRWGGVVHMGTQQLRGGHRGGPWGQRKSGVIVPRRFQEAA